MEIKYRVTWSGFGKMLWVTSTKGSNSWDWIVGWLFSISHPLVLYEQMCRTANPAPINANRANSFRCSSPFFVVTASTKLSSDNSSLPFTETHSVHSQVRIALTFSLANLFSMMLGGKRRFSSLISRGLPFFLMADFNSSSRREREKHFSPESDSRPSGSRPFNPRIEGSALTKNSTSTWSFGVVMTLEMGIRYCLTVFLGLQCNGKNVPFLS